MRFPLSVTLAACLLSFTAFSSSHAGVITFGDFKNSTGASQGWTDDTSVTMGTITQDGVSFTLTITALGPSGATVNLFDDTIGGITGGQGGRLDSRDIGNPSDDESFGFSLAISGASLNALSFLGIDLTSFNTAGRNLDAGDGIKTVNLASGNRTVNYGGDLSGLTALTLANANTWQLQFTARDNTIANPDTFSAASFDNVSFGYTLASPVPEPTTSLMFAAILLGAIPLRRRSHLARSKSSASKR